MMQKEGMTEKVEKTLEIPVSEPKENVEPKEVPESKEEDEEDEKTKAYKELIYQQLVQNEVDEEIAKSIMDEVNRSLAKNAPLDQILANIYQKIILMLGQPYSIKSEEKEKQQPLLKLLRN